MGVIYGSATGSNGDRVNVWIEWSEGTIDYANNRSYVYARFYAQTKADKSSSTYDNQGHSHFYINGGLATDRTGVIDFRSPARPLNTLGTWEGWVQHDGNGDAVITFSGDFSLSSSYISGGSAAGTVGLSTIWTQASAPSNPRISPNPYENSVTLLWDRGNDGVNNHIGTYHLYFRLRDGVEQGRDVGNTTSYTLDTTSWGRGETIDFHIAAITQKGDNPWSGYSNAATKNGKPYQPTSPDVPKTSYIPGEIIRVTFANIGDPDGNLKGYEVATDQNESIVGRNESGAAYVDVNTTGWQQGIQRRFRVRGYDTFEVPGDWSQYTRVVTLNTTPLAPEINYPIAGSTVFNQRPHVLVSAGVTNDGPKHILCVNDGSEKTTAVNGSVFSCGAADNLSSARKVVYVPSSQMGTGSKTFTARMYDSFLYSGAVTRAFSISAFASADEDISLPGMPIKAVHITELQTAIGQLRAAYGLPVVSWTPCLPGVTKIGNAAIITELQNALQAVMDRINQWDTQNTTYDISIEWVNPAAAGGGVEGLKLRQAIEQLRSAIKAV